MTSVNLIYDFGEIARFETLVVQPTLAEKTSGTTVPAIVVSLFCRSKYESAEAKQDKALHTRLEQDIYTQHSELDILISKFQRPRAYTHRQMGDLREVSSSTLVVYMSMNPRDQIAPLLKLHQTVMGAVLTGAKIPERLDHALVQEIHKSEQHRVWVEVDIDTKDRTRIRRFFQHAGEHTPDILSRIAFTVETRGGYHIVFRKCDFPADMWRTCGLPEFAYTEPGRDGRMCQKTYFDIRGDVCVPVPGTLQGGFPVRMVNILDVIKQD